ncbi:MAG: hypothetical protein OK441_02900 [Thaumarchaeota archaeon]|nr:hypothetical protein [Nitrososphaerota archaeon]
MVDVLLLANVDKALSLGKLSTLRRKARTYFLLPLAGLVLGASCCLSVPALLTFAFPSVTAVPGFLWVYYSTYFLFPLFAIAILYANAVSIDRLSATISDPSPAEVRWAYHRSGPAGASPFEGKAMRRSEASAGSRKVHCLT